MISVIFKTMSKPKEVRQCFRFEAPLISTTIFLYIKGKCVCSLQKSELLHLSEHEVINLPLYPCMLLQKECLWSLGHAFALMRLQRQSGPPQVPLIYCFLLIFSIYFFYPKTLFITQYLYIILYICLPIY